MALTVVLTKPPKAVAVNSTQLLDPIIWWEVRKMGQQAFQAFLFGLSALLISINDWFFEHGISC
jgi:hypothetical protein